MVSVHKIQKGDSPWKIASNNLKSRGAKVDNNAIIKEMQRLAVLNGCKNAEDLGTKFFNKIGLELKLDSSNPSSDPVVSGKKSSTQINTSARIEETIRKNGHKSSVIQFNQLTNQQKKQIVSYKNLYGIEPKLVKDESTKEIYAIYDLSQSQRAQKTGLKFMSVKLGNGVNTIDRQYSNGKIVQDKEYLSDPKKNTSTLIKASPKKNTSRKIIDKPLSINITVSPELTKGASDSQKADFNKFVQTLKDQKESLMQNLNIDNDTYNRFAKLAISIAVQESGLEKGLSAKRSLKGSTVGNYTRDSVAVVNSGLEKIGLKNPIKSINATAASKGLTQIKIGDWDDNPRVEKLFAKYGITRGYFNTLSPEQSAAATIIVLNELKNKVQNSKSYQDGIEAANNKYYLTTQVLENGQSKSYPNGYWRYNTVTEDDAILYLYNGRSGALANGNATPADNIYTHNVRRYNQLVKISENPNERTQAEKSSRIVTSDNSNTKKMCDDLGWGIGQVTFRPDLYKGGANKNNEREINNLKTSLIARGYNINNVEKLISKLSKGELSFAKGLTKAEIDAITESDVELLLSHADSLNKKLKNVSNPSQMRKIATSADKMFKGEYLASHAKKVPLSSVQKSAIELTNNSSKNVKSYPLEGYYTGAYRRCKSLLPQLRGKHKPDGGLYSYQNRVNNGLYTGFCVESDKGINYNNASEIDVLLAQNGADTANTLRTSGACLTGAKQALIGSGAVTQEEMRSFNNAFQLAKFLEKYPERFIEVTHVKIDDKTAREITAGDISSLPAGCIVVFGNKSRTDVPGHAAITSGNGQMYADETDNSNWDNFVATSTNQDGKGEHGYVRIFRLNPSYYAMSENGKILEKK